MIVEAFQREFEVARKKNWPYIYVFCDIHLTITEPNYIAGEITTKMYPLAKEVLQLMTVRPDFRLIMWTCSHLSEIEQYVEFFEKLGIKFDWINENPEVVTGMTSYGNYDKKPYTNILIDDKAGFHPRYWPHIYEFLKLNPDILSKDPIRMPNK